MTLTLDSFTVGWICALSIEHVAVCEFLDEEYDEVDFCIDDDSNDYTLGRIGQHNVAIAVLPDGEYGTSVAGSVAINMIRSFPNIRIGLMVGIGGGAPSAQSDIRLGDVVVSSPKNGTGGVLQYDYGKTIQNKEFMQTSFLNEPPSSLRSAVAGLRTQHLRKGNSLHSAVDEVLRKNPRLAKKFGRPNKSLDVLYRSQFVHQCEGNCFDVCGSDRSNIVVRPERDKAGDEHMIFYGVIASANQLMKNALIRDKLSEENGVLCFEMEAGGLMNRFPCLVIRGICDYADSHKNDIFQGYSAMTAAAYARELLLRIQPKNVEREQKANNVISGELKGIRQHMDNIRQKVLNIDQSYQNHTYDMICDWLSSAEHEKHLSLVKSLITPGTGTWFLSHPTYEKWKTADTQNLLCHGIGGAGKTCLSGIIIEDLLKYARENSGYGTVFYFCSYRRRSSQTSAHLLSNMLAQIGRWTRPFPLILEELYADHYPHRQVPSLERLLQAFLQIAKSRFSTLFLVLDALDEYIEDGSNQDRLAEVVQSIQQQCDSVKLLVTSRPESELLIKLEKKVSSFEKIEIRASKQDLGGFLRSHLSNMKSLEQEDTEFTNHMIEKVTESVDGMFLLARLYCDDLKSALHRLELETKLLNLDKGSDALHRAYQGTIERIQMQPRPYRKLAESVLLWVLKAKRPLIMRELQIAISIEPSDNCVDARKFIPAAQIISVCAGLVTWQKDNDLVLFSHGTVAEHLGDSNHSWILEGEESLSIACIRYLEFASLEIGAADNLEDRLKSLPFLQYAARYGGYHASESKVEYSREQFDVFLDDQERLDAINQVIWSVNKSERYFQKRHKLHILAFFGLHQQITKALDHKLTSLANHSDERQTPEQGDSQLSCVEQSLPDDSYINIRDGRKQTMLHYASLEGHNKVVQVLLDRGANVDVQSDKYDTPLDYAMTWDRDEIVLMLLKNKAHPNPSNFKTTYPLLRAVRRGHNQFVRMLIENGANLDTPLASTTPLASAVMARRRATFDILLSAGADVNARSLADGSALHAAASVGDLDMMRVLLNKNARVDARGGAYGTVLATAAAEGHDAAVELLISHQANVNAVGERGTALWFACRYNREKTVKLLIDKGASHSICMEQVGSPLYLAAWRGHTSIVELLLNAGADVNSTGYHGSPLQVASFQGYTELVKILLAKQPNLDSRSGRYGFPLQDAACTSNNVIIELLLDAGADINAKGGHFCTALQAAAMRGDESTVRKLIDRGADVNIQGGFYGSALAAAVERGRDNIVSLLLEKGAVKEAPATLLGSTAASGSGSYQDLDTGAEGLPQPDHILSQLDQSTTFQALKRKKAAEDMESPLARRVLLEPLSGATEVENINTMQW